MIDKRKTGESHRKGDDSGKRPDEPGNRGKIRTPEDLDHAQQEHTDQLRKRYKEQWEKNRRKYPDRFSPWLVIRYSAVDIGLRPIPPAAPFWTSPDIWVESSDPLGNGVAGQQNFVHARVFNLGMGPAAPVRLDFYWANPSLGLDAAHMNHIGTEWMIIPSLQSRDVRCSTPWVPSWTDGAHQCLMVHCTAPLTDPLSAPFQPRLDRHVGQRNITVVNVGAGQTLKMSLAVTNLFPLPARVTLHARMRRFRVDWERARTVGFRTVMEAITAHGLEHLESPAALRRRYREGTPEFAVAERMARQFERRAVAKLSPRVTGLLQPVVALATLRGALTPTLGALDVARPGATLARMLLANDKLVPCEGGATRHVVDLAAADMRPLEMRVLDLELDHPRDGGANDVLVWDIEQRLADILVGGYTVIAVMNADDPRWQGTGAREGFLAGLGGSDMTKKGEAPKMEPQTLRLIIEESDAARDILQLVEQLAHALPIHSFDELRKACGPAGIIRFRGSEFHISQFDGLLPTFVFPIADERGLVERLGQLIRMVPPHIGQDPSDEETARRLMRQSFTFGAGKRSTVGTAIHLPAGAVPAVQTPSWMSPTPGGPAQKKED